MCDISVFSCRRFTAWHRNKYSLFSFDHLDIVNHKFIVQRNRDDCSHLTIQCNFAHSHICNFHPSIAFPSSARLCAANFYSSFIKYTFGFASSSCFGGDQGHKLYHASMIACDFDPLVLSNDETVFFLYNDANITWL